VLNECKNILGVKWK